MAWNWLSLKWRRTWPGIFRSGPARRTLPNLLALLAALVALALLAGLLSARSAPPPAEVVTAQPLHAGYALPVAASRAAGSGQARAEIPVSFYDFGRIPSRAIVRHDFYLVNRGSVPLVIRQAYTTCGCTSADLTASVIPPGKASRVTVTFNAGFHPAAGQTVRRGLVLETNDPNQPLAEIWVQASVK
jgi:hypothetical protein